MGEQHPKKSISGHLTTLMFKANEWLVGAYGSIKRGLFRNYIDITFVTKKTDGSRAVYGPYGSFRGASTMKYNMSGAIIGYWGNTGVHDYSRLESVGFYYYETDQ